MKVLTATNATQGARYGDFSNCTEGDLVWMLEPCAQGKRNPLGRCGCARSFSGLIEFGSTTTALVRDVPGLNQVGYEATFHILSEGVPHCLCCRSRDRTVASLIEELLGIASDWPTGTLLGRRRNSVVLRSPARAVWDEDRSRTSTRP